MILWRSMAFAAVFCFAGCGAGRPPVPDAQQARATLVAALDEWTVASGSRTLDNLVFAEPLFEKGVPLESYEIVKFEQDGSQSRGVVKLKLHGAGGKPTDEKAEYVVVTAPKRSVVRTSEGW